MSHPQSIAKALRPGLLALIAAAVLPTGCAMHTWRATPIAEGFVQEKARPKRTVRVETSTGFVLLDVASVRYPVLEGRARPGGGEVLFDATTARRAERVAGATSHQLAASPDEMRRAPLAGELVRFHTGDGPVVLEVTSFEYPLARGRPRACPTPSYDDASCPGLVQVDLREASRLEIREVDVGSTVVASVGVAAIVYVAVVLVMNQPWAQ